LEKLACRQPSTHAYVQLDRDFGYSAEVLGRANFCETHALDLLICNDFSEARANCEWTPANSAPDRERVAEFMSLQFFCRQGYEFRGHVIRATANAVQLDLACLSVRNRIAAAVMLSRDSGTLGIYNLCVAPRYRRQGFGTSLLRACLKFAEQENLAATLQCDPGLTTWYKRLGFRPIGRLGVFSLLQLEPLDIMEQRSILQGA
jgi:ribosomal protein S18 acetylase RimI-like enzyme